MSDKREARPHGVNPNAGLQCPGCNTIDRHRVVDCRGLKSVDKIRRRREFQCGLRFTTFEFIAA